MSQLSQLSFEELEGIVLSPSTGPPPKPPPPRPAPPPARTASQVIIDWNHIYGGFRTYFTMLWLNNVKINQLFYGQTNNFLLSKSAKKETWI